MKRVNIGREENLDIKEFLQRFIMFSDTKQSLTPNEVKMLSEVYARCPEPFGPEAKKEVQSTNGFGASYMSQTLSNLVEKGFVVKEKRTILVSNAQVVKLIEKIKSEGTIKVSLNLTCNIDEERNDQKDSI